jgi:predicted glycoside hydrolase/deacetylase ChbG (UPF0249 family)
MMRKECAVAVCADDFGLDPQVNEGALVLAELGRISAIACMVGAPFWRSGAGALRCLDPTEVEAGLHLDLTEHPLDPHLRHSLPEWILRSHAGVVDLHGLRREVDAQLDTFVDEMQRPPAFVDGHQHVHQLPGVRDVLVEALVARGLRPWLRSTRRPRGLRSRKAWLVESLGASGLARRAQANGFRQNRRLLGIYDFDAAAGSYQRWLRSWLAMAEGGDLLVCHPAAGWPLSATLAAARCREYEVLADPAFGAFLEEARVHIAPLHGGAPRAVRYAW